MSTFEKRAREDKRNQKARGKAQRRMEKRNASPSTQVGYTVPSAGGVVSLHPYERQVHLIKRKPVQNIPGATQMGGRS